MGVGTDRIDAINKAHREFNRANIAYGHSLYRNDGTYKVLYQEYLRAMDRVTGLLVVTLRGMGYDTAPHTDRAYPELDSQLYVSIEGYHIDIRFSYYEVGRYRLMLQDDMDRPVVDLLPTYVKGTPLRSIESVVVALDEVSTTIRKYKQCTRCYYSTDSHEYYCGVGAVPELPQCNQYRHSGL